MPHGGAATVGGLLLLVVVGTACWVAFDAPAHRMSALLGLGVLMRWIVAFPWYLAERGRAQRTFTGPPPGEWLPDPADPERLERRPENDRWTRDARVQPW